MSLEKIVQEAMAGRPLEMKEAFQEEIQTRMAEALEEKFVSVMEAKSKDADEDDDADDEDKDAPKSKDDDEDEDDDDDDSDSDDEDDKPAFLKKKNEEVEEASDETLEEGPFKGIGKMMMKRKLNKANDRLDKARTANKNDQRDAIRQRGPDPVTGLPGGDSTSAREINLLKKSRDIKAKKARILKATDRLNRKPNNVKFDFNDR
jgi:hypothetical protein